MNEKPITIKSSEVKVSKSNKEYLEVIDQDDDKYSCWDNELWNSLGKNLSVVVGFEKKGIFRNIIAVQAIKPEDVPKPQEPTVHQDKIDPQEQGMWYKEIGLNYRAGLIKDTPEGKAMMATYWTRMFIALGITRKASEPKGE